MLDPLCREYPPCAVSKRQENRLLPYLQENPPVPYQRLENPIRHPATEDTLTGGIHQAELFFCIRNYSKTVPVAEGNVPLAGDSVVAVGIAQRPVGDAPLGGTAGPPLGKARGIGKSHIDLPRHKAVGRSLLTDRVSAPPQYDAGTSPFASPFPLSITPRRSWPECHARDRMAVRSDVFALPFSGLSPLPAPISERLKLT